MRCRQASRIVCPGFRQIPRPVDEGLAMARDVECKPPDLAVVMLPAEPVYCWPTPQEALPAWESRFFNDENGSRVGERLHRLIRSEERRVGKTCVRTCNYRWATSN